jgi:hypothetical protein
MTLNQNSSRKNCANRMNRKLTVMLLSLMTLTFSSDIANLPSDVEPNVAMPRRPKDCRMRKRDDNTSPCSFQSFGRDEWICSEVPSGSLGLSPSASHGSGSWNPTNINKQVSKSDGFVKFVLFDFSFMFLVPLDDPGHCQPLVQLSSFDVVSLCYLCFF